MTNDSKTLKMKALELAKKIVFENYNPNQGCSDLAEISKLLGCPDSFSMIDMLAHEQHGHERFGIYKEDLIEEIMDECKGLISKIKSELFHLQD